VLRQMQLGKGHPCQTGSDAPRLEGGEKVNRTFRQLERLDALKHRTCDRWGHCKPSKERQRHTMGELIIWALLLGAALWMLAQLGGVKL